VLRPVLLFPAGPPTAGTPVPARETNSRVIYRTMLLVSPVLAELAVLEVYT